MNLILNGAILFQNSVFTHPELNYVSAFPSKVHTFSVCSDTVNWNAIFDTEIENLVDCENKNASKGSSDTNKENGSNTIWFCCC